MAASERVSRSPQPIPITLNVPRRNLSPPSLSARAPLNGARRSSMTRRARNSFSNRASTSMPAMDGLVLLSHSAAASEEAVEDEMDDDGDFGFEDDDDEEPRGRRGSQSRLKHKGEMFTCEKCGKAYRHPACLTKHRWQHTEYWKEASKLMLSKHQSVQMLEAAAILVSAHALPDEKSLWPAAVSPPSSGLLGSEQLNSEVISMLRASPSPSPVPLLQLPEADVASHAEDDHDDDTSSDGDDASSAMDVDSRLDDVDMFDFELDANGSAQTSSPEDGSYKTNLAPPRLSVVNPAHAARAARTPAQYGISAPQLGFFAPRSPQ